MPVSLLFRYGEPNKSGDAFQWKGSLLLTVFKRRGHATPCRAKWGSTRVSLGAEGTRGEMWARAFIVFSVSRNR